MIFCLVFSLLMNPGERRIMKIMSFARDSSVSAGGGSAILCLFVSPSSPRNIN